MGPPARRSQEPPASSPSATRASPTTPPTSSPPPGAPQAPTRTEPTFLEVSLLPFHLPWCYHNNNHHHINHHNRIHFHNHHSVHHNSSRLEAHLQHSVRPGIRKALRVPVHLAGQDLHLVHQGGRRPGQALVLHHGRPGWQPCGWPGTIWILLSNM